MTRHVNTPYGPAPGCPDCGVILLGPGPHLCEHGVTTNDPIVVELTATIDDPDLYRHLIEG